MVDHVLVWLWLAGGQLMWRRSQAGRNEWILRLAPVPPRSAAGASWHHRRVPRPQAATRATLGDVGGTATTWRMAARFLIFGNLVCVMHRRDWCPRRFVRLWTPAGPPRDVFPFGGAANPVPIQLLDWYEITAIIVE